MNKYIIRNSNDIMNIPPEHIDEFLREVKINHKLWYEARLNPATKSFMEFTPDGQNENTIEIVSTGELIIEEKSNG